MELAAKKAADEAREPYIGDMLNVQVITTPVIEVKPELQDFYNKRDEYEVTAYDKKKYEDYLITLDEYEKAILDGQWNYYQVKFSNEGGLPMPIILEFTYSDNSKERHYIPSEIWKRDDIQVSKVFYSKKEIASIVLDPNLETADIDRSDNYWPTRIPKSRFDVYQGGGRYGKKSNEPNEMQKAKQ